MDMQIVMKAISELKPYEKNPRRNENAVEAVANSIQAFGFKVPVVIDGDGVIVCGHTRFKAAKRLGLAEVPCIVADDLTEEQIKAFRLADNKVGELATWDDELLSLELSELEELEINMEEFGFSFDDADDIETEKERDDLSDSLKDEYSLIIECTDENELETLYEEMMERGYACRLSTL